MKLTLRQLLAAAACALAAVMFVNIGRAAAAGERGPSQRQQAALDALTEVIQGSVVYTHRRHIYVTPLGRWEPVDLGPGEYARWSPDGRRLAVYLRRTVMVMDADGGDRRVVTKEALARDGSPIEFHPDGRRIIFVRRGKPGLWTADIHSGDVAPLVRSPNFTGEPCISADGLRLVGRVGRVLQTVDLRTGQTRTYERQGCSPGVSPDGRLIMNNGDRGRPGHHRMNIRRFDNSQIRVLDTTAIGRNLLWDNHHWTNHNAYIAGQMGSGGNGDEAWLIHTPSGRATQLTFHGGGVQYPDVFIADPTPPTAPADVRPKIDDDGDLLLRWEPAVDGESAVKGYRVEVGGRELAWTSEPRAVLDRDAIADDGSVTEVAVYAVNGVGRSSAPAVSRWVRSHRDSPITVASASAASPSPANSTDGVDTEASAVSRAGINVDSDADADGGGATPADGSVSHGSSRASAGNEAGDARESRASGTEAAATSQAPYRTLGPKYDRVRSRVVIRQVAAPTRAMLDYAADHAHVMMFNPAEVSVKAPATRPTLADLHFEGTLAAGSIVDRASQTPLSAVERSQTLAFEPVLRYLESDEVLGPPSDDEQAAPASAWDFGKLQRLMEVGWNINEQMWADDRVPQDYQRITNLYIHTAADGRKSVWVRVEFKPWVTFLRGVVDDEDGDGFAEIYGRLPAETVDPALLERLLAPYRTTRMTPRQIEAWGRQLVDVWYDRFNTKWVDLAESGRWPTAQTSAAIRKAVAGVEIPPPAVVIHSQPFGQPIDTVLIIAPSASAQR